MRCGVLQAEGKPAMKLGILVNTDRHLTHILGLAAAATAKNHEFAIFTMDQGVRLLDDESFAELGGADGVSLSVCGHSAREQGISTEGRPAGVTVGSQLNNAMMAQSVDRMIVL
jgi:sulfur relay (sulfurtransferase) complex TusBCD TusD component (DsrE family)